MTDLIFFLGRFHVLALHLPIGMLLLTVGLDFLSQRSRYQYLAHALPLCWGATAISAVLTVLLGLMHFSEGGFEGPSASAHRNYGISVAVLCLMVWFVSEKLPALYKQVRLVSNLLLLFLVTMTGHYGGNLTHGSTYLVEYAPQSIRSMAGLEPRRAEVLDIALADPWYDIVHPMLQARCSSCHNNDKQSGQLNLSSLETLLLGGKSGASVVSGDVENSELFSRISLPENHEDFMPAEGKTPLTESQREIVRWWINAGLPVDTSVAEISPTEEISQLLALELGLESAPMLQVIYPPVANDTLMSLLNLGWQIRPLSQDSNGLIMSVLSKGQAVSREMLLALSGVRDSVVEINLASSGLSNDLLVELASFPVLGKLNLSNNSIGDAGMEVLSSIASLHLLNLYGNPQISDAGLSSLSGLTELDTVYLWGTGVTPEGTELLAAALPELSIQGQSLMLLNDGNAE
ncbi:MAG: hypothetical protein P8M72_09480 [Gammaproteobacteria bacterium]|nr:hypothetical protein [Gammaproteobacteria bacterium]